MIDEQSQQLPPTQGQVSALLTSMETLSGEIDNLRADLHKANFRTRVATVVAAVAIVLVIGAGWLAIEARNNTHAIKEARADARVASCIQDNALIAGIRAGIVTTNLSGILVFAPDPNNLTPEEQTIFDAYAAATGAAAESAVPFRDCSDAGLETYFSAPLVDPGAPPATTAP